MNDAGRPVDDTTDDNIDDTVDESADARARDDDAVEFDLDATPRPVSTDLESDWQRVEDEAFAGRRTSSIDAGRRKGGAMGAAMAGAMLAIREIYEGPQQDDMVAVSESPDEPGDIDKDGIVVTVGDVEVESRLPDT